jgi:hypothetical protein
MNDALCLENFFPMIRLKVVEGDKHTDLSRFNEVYPLSAGNWKIRYSIDLRSRT